jgi:hypothetical protein
MIIKQFRRTEMNKTAGNGANVQTNPMGTVDIFLGLVAAVTNVLRKNHGPEAGKIPVGLMCNVLHEMQSDERFEAELRYLDFDRIGDNWISKTLEDFLFQAGTWGLHKVPNPAVAMISLDADRADRRLDALKAEFGDAAVEKLNEMAQEFVLLSKTLSP